jgi:cysteinyl-tRNA synthetase
MDAPSGKPTDEFLEALTDDLNTPRAITELHRLHKQGNLVPLKAGLEMLGLVDAYYQGTKPFNKKAASLDKALVESLLLSRNAARARKDFKESDRIRNELAAMGVVLKDSKDGTTWEIAR